MTYLIHIMQPFMQSLVKPLIKPMGASGLAILLATTGVALAEQNSKNNVISLQQQDLDRLGIRFAPVQPVSSKDGFRVPAMVSHSPDSRSVISSRTSAVLKQWHAAGGERVEADAPVVTLASNELMQTQQQWLAARQNLAQSQVDLQRDKQLFDDGIIARQRLQQSQRKLSQAQFDLRVWQQQLQQAGLSDGELKQLYEGSLMPGEITLRSPQSGILSRSFVRSGDLVNSNQTLATVTDDNALWVRANVNATLGNALNTGDKLGLLEDPTPLTLMSKNLDVAEQTQTIELQARFNGSANVNPGQQVTLLIGGQQSGWHIPASAVTHSDGKTTVYVKNQEGIEIRELQLLPLGQGYLATTGLTAGEQLVVQGSAQLKGIQLGLGGGE